MVSIFIIRRIMKKIWNRKGLYAVVILQIAIGMLILNLFLSLNLDINNQFNSLLENNKNKEFYITAQYRKTGFFDALDFDIITWGQQEAFENEYESVPMKSTTLSELKKEFPKIDFKIEVNISMDVYRNGQLENYQLCYSSIYDTVKMQDVLVKEINQKESFIIILPRNFPFKINEKEFTTMSGVKYNIEYIEGNTIYIPIEVYDTLYHPKDLMNIKLVLIMKEDIRNAADEISGVVEYLTEINKDFKYNVNSEYYNILNKVNTAYEQAKAFQFIAIILLIIILVGLSGLFSLIMNTRKRELAICLALGATKAMLYFESLLEMLFLAITGCLVGAGISLILLLYGFEYATVIIQPHFSIFVIEIIISCFIALISVMPAIIAIKRLMPMELLRAE